MLSRRQFIKAGVLGGAVLAAAGAWFGVAYHSGMGGAGHLNDDARSVLAAVVPVMLAEALPEGSGRPAAIAATVDRFGVAVGGLGAAAQKEVGELFGLLSFPPTRFLVAGVHRPWPDAAGEEVAAFLGAWRFSRFALLRSAYAALHDLIYAAWYGNPESWPAIDYPGPPEVS
ncbi:MAG: hypothetical protein WBP72_17050 [Rhodocyclaceae bacterium]